MDNFFWFIGYTLQVSHTPDLQVSLVHSLTCSEYKCNNFNQILTQFLPKFEPVTHWPSPETALFLAPVLNSLCLIPLLLCSAPFLCFGPFICLRVRLVGQSFEHCAYAIEVSVGVGNVAKYGLVIVAGVALCVAHLCIC